MAFQRIGARLCALSIKPFQPAMKATHSQFPVRLSLVTDVGTFVATYSACGLAELDFPTLDFPSATTASSRHAAEPAPRNTVRLARCIALDGSGQDARTTVARAYGELSRAASCPPPLFLCVPAATIRTILPAPPEVLQWHALTKIAVCATLAGTPAMQMPPLDLTQGTAFQQSVWRELQAIGAGQTRSYGEVAAALGRPKATRAVGGACGANPVPLLIPCHRVLAAGGGLGGFSGGLEWKRRLLQAEGWAGDKGKNAGCVLV